MIELKLITEFPQEIIAVDEVGRSPLSGPVVIGAVRLVVNDHASLIGLLRSLRRCGVKDSKQLPHEQRMKLLEKFMIQNLPYREKGIFRWKGIELSFITWNMDHDVIDQENIFAASMRGMKEAVAFLSVGDKSQTTVLIDGQSKFRWETTPAEWREIPIIKGDIKSSLIGLASIIAKEKRDSWMRQMHENYPQYGFITNYGYPTREHRLAIQEHGPCPIHRLTFSKVKEFIRESKKTEEVG